MEKEFTVMLTCVCLDIATRVINRMVNKREDFNMFISNLSTKQYSEFTNSLREYFNLVVQNLQSTDKVTFLALIL